ncbi:hypothetical protein Bhyg_04861 [Pseudolycoriella hygida]|uniref:Shugoshin C-terminal domain-containing protein n=1 Tax=Pseudolycoriella hygida TaxID=35572 RepID=A0A9Q0NG59_9DIPT|nr:hypothetical protein Bhyg_04861 [Pseudolycoriella hygida]
MNESVSDESSIESFDENDTGNESDNKLAQYMLINKNKEQNLLKELSKSLVVLKAENAKLRNNNKELSLEILSCRNELASNRIEIKNLRAIFTNLQKYHIQHMETLTSELQTYAVKLATVFQDDNVSAISESKDKSRLTEQIAHKKRSSTDDANKSRVSESLEPQKRYTKPVDFLEENPSNLNTINEETENEFETSSLEQISLVTSTHESVTDRDSIPTSDESETTENADESETSANANESQTIVNADQTETLTNAPTTRSVSRRMSAVDTSEMGSMNSNKENERPSTLASETIISNDEESSLHATKTFQKSIKESITPLREKFITKRTRKRTNDQNSFEAPNSPELVSSTPYKRKRSATSSDSTPKSKETIKPTPDKSNDSTRMTRRATMSTSTSGRPLRNVRPVNLIEPKLNTKLRRPK